MNVNNSEVVAEIRKQLDWRGPNGKAAGHVVLERAAAELLLAQIDLQQAATAPRQEPS